MLPTITGAREQILMLIRRVKLSRIIPQTGVISFSSAELAAKARSWLVMAHSSCS